MYFIGDVHGKFKDLKRVIEKNTLAKYRKHSGPIIQVGDMGFSYPASLNKYSNFHFIGGNHDNWDILEYDPPPSFLGRFGYCDKYNPPFFYISGGFSIDKAYRVQAYYKGHGKSYWASEELSWAEGVAMLTEYQNIKPDVVVSHSLPTDLARLIGNPGVLKAFNFNPSTFTTSTQELLQQAFELHQPKYWIHGHMHKSHMSIIKGTKFIGLDELQILDYYDLLGDSD